LCQKRDPRRVATAPRRYYWNLASGKRPIDAPDPGVAIHGLLVAPRSDGAIIRGVSETLSLTVHFEDAGDGWVLATIAEVPGAISQGRTREEARENVIDALRTVLTPDHQLAGQAPSGDDESLTLTIP
jgi:predicted RNase H-like HicB family nuclease